MPKFFCERSYVEAIELPFLRNVLIAEYCADNFTYLNLVDLYYRRLHSNMIVVILVVLIVFPCLFVSISAASRRYLAVSMKGLTRRLHLSPSLAAATFVALANGAPDIFSSVANANKPEPFLMSLGTLLGAFVFTTTFVLMNVIYSVPSQIVLPKLAVLKELGFYLYTLIFLCLLGLIRAKTLSVVAMLAGTYVAYLLATAVVEKKLEADRQELIRMAIKDEEVGYFKRFDTVTLAELMPRASEFSAPRERNLQELDQTYGESINSTINLSLKMLQEEILDPTVGPFQRYNQIILTVGGLLSIPYIYNPLMSTRLRFLVVSLSAFFIAKYLLVLTQPWYVLAVCSANLGLACLLLECLKVPERVTDTIYEIFAIFGAMTWIKIFSVLTLDFISFLSFYFSLEEITLAILVIAAGNSIPDFFNNTALALHDEGVMAAMASYSGQTFNTLVGFSAYLLLHWKKHGEVRFDPFGLNSPEESRVFFGVLPGKNLVVVVLIFFTFLVLILTLSYMSRHGFVLKRFFGVVMLAVYVVFVAAIIGTSLLIKMQSD